MDHLVARIKRTSKYSGQTQPGAWFDVRVVDDVEGYCIRGNSNRYRLDDVTVGVRLDSGFIIDLASGKKVKKETA